MSSLGSKPKVDALHFTGGADLFVFSGDLTTRQTVATAFPGVPKGSLYISTTGKIYQKTAFTGASVEGDWVKVSTSAAD